MRLVYIDEAGISNRDHEPYLVVAGVVVDADKKLIALERHIDSLIERNIPEHQRRGFVFHATELFNGGGKTFKRNDPEWPLERRLDIADKIASTLRKFNLPIPVGLVERKKFPASGHFDPKNWGTKDKTVAEHAMAFLSCAAEIEMWMREEASDEVCLLIVEDNQRARSLITTLQNAYQRPHAPIRNEMEARYFPFKKIKESPLFAGKSQSKVLQIADFCAYVLKKALMDDERYKRFMIPWGDLIIPSQDAAAKREKFFQNPRNL